MKEGLVLIALSEFDFLFAVGLAMPPIWSVPISLLVASVGTSISLSIGLLLVWVMKKQK
jgi:hypothetical protein